MPTLFGLARLGGSPSKFRLAITIATLALADPVFGQPSTPQQVIQDLANIGCEAAPCRNPNIPPGVSSLPPPVPPLPPVQQQLYQPNLPSVEMPSTSVVVAPTQQMTPAQSQALKNAMKDIGSIQPPPAPIQRPLPSNQPSLVFVPPSGSTFTQPSTPASSPAANSLPSQTTRALPVTPGGISLSRAAAERMPLNLSLEGAYLTSSGRLILSGRASSDSIDAALLMTAMRVACEGEDLYFSLDPDDGAAWFREGQEASNALWQRIRDGFKHGLSQSDARRKNNILELTTVSARRDYPQVWASLLPQYPHLKSRLVFKPEWLGQTRLGQLLYKADVLLKELSYGVSLLEDGPLRARAVKRYAPAGERAIGQSLLGSLESKPVPSSPEWRGSRLWFDLVPERTDQRTCTVTPSFILSCISPPPVFLPPTILFVRQAGGPRNKIAELQEALISKGLLDFEPTKVSVPEVAIDSGALDLSRISPRMFVRRHDQTTGQDLPGNDPDLDELARSVNSQIDEFIRAYHELRSLSEVFRAYVAAVKLVPQTGEACRRLSDLPLLDEEKLTEPLPQHHPSELFITVGSFEYSEGRTRRLQTTQAFGINGGVSAGAQTFLSANLKSGPTAITQLLLHGLVQGEPPAQTWQLDDRKFVSLDLGENFTQSSPGNRTDTPVLVAANDATGADGRRYYPIENEPSAAQMPPAQRTNPENQGRWAVIILVTASAALLFGRHLFAPRR
jgi:hypothetical protein